MPITRVGRRVEAARRVIERDEVLLARMTPGPHAPSSLSKSSDLRARLSLIASTFPVEAVREMIAQGHPFFAYLGDAALVGVPTGHWPMLSEPAALADALGAL